MKTGFNLSISALALVFTSSLAHAGGSSTVGDGPVSPQEAADNCIALKGSIEQPAGHDANCVIEEWALYQEMSEQNLVQHHQYSGMVPNPASVNCIDIGGTDRLVNTPPGEEGMCVVDIYELYSKIKAKP